jgi:hypothetical protein
MGWTGHRNCTKNISLKASRVILERDRRQCEDKIKMYRIEIYCEGVNWIKLQVARNEA